MKLECPKFSTLNAITEPKRAVTPMTTGVTKRETTSVWLLVEIHSLWHFLAKILNLKAGDGETHQMAPQGCNQQNLEHGELCDITDKLQRN